MKIRVLSDLHIEINGEPDLPDVLCDAVVLAGDTGTKLSGIKWAMKRFPGLPVLYILGNHEYYGDNFFGLLRHARQLCEGTHVKVLEKDHVELGGWSIFGATLWTDLRLLGDPEVAAVDLAAPNGLTEYRRVRYDHGKGFPKLRPTHTALDHERALRALDAFLAGRDPARCVVLTHHAPSPRTLPENEKQHPCAPAYASNLESLVASSGVRLWVHGHIHISADYVLGNTRLVANPLGYRDTPTRFNSTFDPALVVDLEAAF
jgi:predicted phosphodiesterase